MAAQKRLRQFDLFISYATEDFRDVVVNVLGEMYQIGIMHYWMDQLGIGVGESIPLKIDEGLKKSKYALAFITPAYFSKRWTRCELDAIQYQGKRIIPLWINVTAKEVAKFSPTLATLKAIPHLGNSTEVAEQIAEILLQDRTTSYAQVKSQCDQAIVFWDLTRLFIRDCIGIPRTPLQQQLSDLARRVETDGQSWERDVQEQIGLSRADVRRMRKRFPMLSDDEASWAILGTLKHDQGDTWYPFYSNESDALKKAGLGAL